MLGRRLRPVADHMAQPMSADARLDPEVLIIGAGPAGLTAATYFGRFLRRVLVADGGETRADWIPLSHNMPGFPAGITGPHIVSRLRDQAEEYGAVIEAGCVESLTAEDGGFVAVLNGRELHVRAVLLATGVVDHHPNLPGVERAIQRALVRICPICDAYEARDKSVAIIGHTDMGVREAAFMRTYSDRVTLIHVGPPEALTERAALERLGVALVETSIDNVELDGDRVIALGWGGRKAAFDLVYSALGTSPNASLADAISATMSDDGRMIVDDHQQTSVPGLYAAGDVVRGLNQIAVATAEAAVAATAIHNALREADGQTV